MTERKQSKVAAGELKDAIEEGLTLGDYEADELMGATDCEEGCTVEPDGTCSHGYESAALTGGII